MKRLLILLFVLSQMACAASVANAFTLIGGSTNNGDLDVTYAQEINPPAPGFFLPKPQVWINTGFRSITGPYEDEMSSESWAGPAPTTVTTDGFLNPPFPEGCDGNDCAVFFHPFSGNGTDGAATGNLYQDNPAVPGLVYQMNGWAGAEANALMQDAQFAIEFRNASNTLIGGTTLSLLPTLFVPNGQPFNYKPYQFTSVAPAGTASVRARVSMIGATGNPAGGGQAFVVDDLLLQSFTPDQLGDFNHDGKVDGADYVVWRKSNGSSSSYGTWRAHFGTVLSGAGSGSPVDPPEVPEPSSFALILIALVLGATPGGSRLPPGYFKLSKNSAGWPLP